MRRDRLALKVVALGLAASVAVACGGSEPAKPATAEKIVPKDSGEMSPEEAGGMTPAAAPSEAPAAPTTPHGGSPVKFGTVAQLEFVLDPSSGLLTGYVLNGSGQTTRITAKSIALTVTPPGGQPTALSLASTMNGLTGDTVGNSSQFGGTSPGLKGITSFTGVVKEFTAGGQTFKDVAFSYPSR